MSYVLSLVPVTPTAVIRCRPIGALLMEDENGIDEKIIAVPVDALNPFYDGIGEVTDLPSILLDRIEHFFRHHKDLERGKWVSSQDGRIVIKRARIMQAISRFKPA